MGNKKRIGFLSYWGWGRGQCYLTRNYVSMLQNKYDLYIFKQFKNPIAKDFKDFKVNIVEHPTYIVDKDIFIKWVKDNKLDAVMFFEYKQWNEDPNELVVATKELCVKTYAWLTMEKFKKEQTDDYDRIFVSTVSGERFMRVNKVRNFTYIPFSVDLNEFSNLKRNEENDKFVFLHTGGWGGVHNRKNTSVVIEAFRLLNRSDTKLIITSQKPLNVGNLPNNIEIIDKNLSRQEMIDLYYQADCLVYPPKWETIGIGILESLAAGTPVITTNVPPMNEFVKDCSNGYLCSSEVSQYPDISIYVAEVSPEEIKKKMELMLNKMTYELLAKKARHGIETKYNLEKNKKIFIDFLDNDL